MGYYNVDREDVVARGLHAPKPGLNNVGEYQSSGRPFLKTVLGSSFVAAGSIDPTVDTKLADAANEISVEFPFVTSKITIENNTNHPIAVYFCSLTVADGSTPANSGVKENSNYFVLPSSAGGTPLPTLKLNVKSRKVYIAGYTATPTNGYVALAAELTNIEEPYDCDVDGIVGISG